MLVSKAVEGFLLDIAAGPYAPSTVTLYRHILTHFSQAYKIELDQLTLDDLKNYMATKKDYSGSYQDNHWKCFRTFFRWCHATLGVSNIADDLPRPRFKIPEVQPFTETEVKKLLEFAEYTPVFQRSNTKPYRIKRPTHRRDRMIILILLDTGMRVGELLRLEIQDINFDTGEITIAPYSTGRKTRPRVVVIGAVTRRATWLYLAHRPDYQVSERLVPHTHSCIQSVLRTIGENAGVANVHPHRFRHTFAIQYLRNGGDVFTLQRLLGHESLEMVQRYLKLANTDSLAAHRKASPADRWKL